MEIMLNHLNVFFGISENWWLVISHKKKNNATKVKNLIISDRYFWTIGDESTMINWFLIRNDNLKNKNYFFIHTLWTKFWPQNVVLDYCKCLWPFPIPKNQYQLTSSRCSLFVRSFDVYIYSTAPHEQNTTQGQFSSGL